MQRRRLQKDDKQQCKSFRRHGNPSFVGQHSSGKGDNRGMRTTELESTGALATINVSALCCGAP